MQFLVYLHRIHFNDPPIWILLLQKRFNRCILAKKNRAFVRNPWDECSSHLYLIFFFYFYTFSCHYTSPGYRYPFYYLSCKCLHNFFLQNQISNENEAFLLAILVIYSVSVGPCLYLTLILLMWRIGWAPNGIPIYSYIQKDATLHIFFYIWKLLYMFRVVLPPIR